MSWQAATAVMLQDSLGLGKYVTVQMYYSLISRGLEHEFQSFAECHRIGILVWSPTTCGFLTGKYTRANLAPGFLFSEGIIRDRADIRSLGRPSDGSPDIVTIELVEGKRPAPVQAERNFLMTSACGVCGKASLSDLQVNSCPVLPQDDRQIAPATIYGLPDRLRQPQSVFDSTGGLHAAARFSLQGEPESLREDVGRHNAVDKLVGAALMEHRLPLTRSILLVSGRASFELVQKALMGGIPVMAAVGAPSSLAVATAERAGMTLIRYLRNNRFKVYTVKHRILGLEQPR
jgi:FdhD protein